MTCAAPDQCHQVGTCDPLTGTCSEPAAPNDTACDDGNLCTQIDTCQSGACVGGSAVACVASDACHIAGICDPATGMCDNPVQADGTSCSDGDPCTLSDLCQSGICLAGSPLVCAAQDECHVAGSCDSSTGMCTNPAKADGESCSIGTCQGTRKSKRYLKVRLS